MESTFSFKTLDRSQQELGLYVSDPQGSVVKRLLTETDPAWVNVNDDLYFLRNGQFLWASERDGFMHLYRYAADGTLMNQVTRGDWAIVSSHGGAFWVHQGVVGIDEANDWIYFTALKDGSVERQLYRIHADGSRLTRLSKEGVNRHRHVAGRPQLFRHLLQHSYFAGATAARSRRSVSPPSRPHGRRCCRDLHTQMLTIPAADGFAMPAQILKPSGFDPSRKYPVILHVYGGPSAPTVSDSWQKETLFDNVLASKGSVAVAIDNRAATAISKTLENTLPADPGGGEVEDLVAGIRWLEARPWVDGRYGSGFGAGAAAARSR